MVRVITLCFWDTTFSQCIFPPSIREFNAQGQPFEALALERMREGKNFPTHLNMLQKQNKLLLMGWKIGAIYILFHLSSHAQFWYSDLSGKQLFIYFCMQHICSVVSLTSVPYSLLAQLTDYKSKGNVKFILTFVRIKLQQT